MNKMFAISCILLLTIKPIFVLGGSTYVIRYSVRVMEVTMKPTNEYRENETVTGYFTVGTYFENGTLQYGVEINASEILNFTVGKPWRPPTNLYEFYFSPTGWGFGSFAYEPTLINVNQVSKFHILLMNGSVKEYPGFNMTIPKDFNQTCVKNLVNNLDGQPCLKEIENPYWIVQAVLTSISVDDIEDGSSEPFPFWVFPLAILLLFGLLFAIYAIIPERQSFFDE